MNFAFFFFLTLFTLFLLIPNSKQDPQQCFNAILDVFYYRNASHSTEMIDASSFKFNDLGNFDFCYELTSEKIAKYCLISSEISGLVIKVGVCFPYICTEDDLYQITPELLLFLNLPSNTQLEYQIYKTFSLDGRAICMIIVTVILFLIACFGTFIEFKYFILPERERKEFLNENENENENQNKNLNQNPKWMIIFKQFSFILNLKSLTQEHPKSIKFLNGFRVISMLWIILGHSYSATFDTGATLNIYSVVDIFKRFTYQIIPGGEFGVDTFFFLSGFLVSYLTLKKVNQNNGKFIHLGKFYLHRYIRLAPTFVFVLFFSYTLAPYLGYGPVWELTRNWLQKNCEKYWWTNMLLINNFHPTFSKQCMNHLWYLANDCQFYVLVPIFVYAFYRKKLFGWITSLATIIASYIVTIVLVWHYSISPSMLGSHLEQFYNYYYQKPYCRIPTFLIGVSFAFFITQFNIKKFKIPRYLVILLTVFSLFLMGITTFGSYTLYKHDNINVQQEKINWDYWNTAQNVFWITFSRTAFILAVAIFSFLFLSGHLSLVNDFLSADIWIPFAKLTYSVYVVHLILITVVVGSFRDSFYFSGLFISKMFIFSAVASYFFGFIVALLVEFPFNNLQRLLLSR
ncbi:o-acyltransferase [Anaeramoeba ignava]|uniref:O-acyltransferase n=1 Tax=Anaeramoeba ignava TaxID=1746090 RepID=A0A9Q0L8Z6_ANAIG|nr:o-acyltransferase [Anaeramoeba ignava]